MAKSLGKISKEACRMEECDFEFGWEVFVGQDTTTKHPNLLCLNV